MDNPIIVPFVAGFSDEKNIGGQKVYFCQIRFLCEGGTKLWQEDLNDDTIVQIIREAGLEILSKPNRQNKLILLQIKPTSNINSIESWVPNNTYDPEQLYWRSFNFVIQLSTNGKYMYQTPVPNYIYINPITVQQLLNTILKVCLDIDIE